MIAEPQRACHDTAQLPRTDARERSGCKVAATSKRSRSDCCSHAGSSPIIRDRHLRMDQMEQFDVVVIGSGPAGEGAAMMAAKNHRSVALIERYFEVGGGCTHWGTIPSKALRHAVKILHDLRRNPLLREFRAASQLTYPQLLASASKVVEAQVASRRRFYERNRVPIFSGEAHFVDPHTFEVRPASRQAHPHRREAYRDRCGLASVPSARSRLRTSAHPRQRFDPALRRTSVLGHDLRRRRHRLRVRVDLHQPRRQGHARQHARSPVVVSRR